MKIPRKDSLIAAVILFIVAALLVLFFKSKVITVEGFTDSLAGISLAIYSVWLIKSLLNFKKNIQSIKIFYRNIITPLIIIFLSGIYFFWIDGFI